MGSAKYQVRDLILQKPPRYGWITNGLGAYIVRIDGRSS
jgi:hypothetical protein